MLDLDSFFTPRIYGALDDYKNFSKAQIIARILSDPAHDAGGLIGFGDGFVEIEEIKRVGGVAVGVASNEETREGINPWKRERLVRAGADVIIGDYRALDELCALLGIAR